MTNASEHASTVNPAEARHFDALAADWWNPTGSSAMLHRLNPPRLRYIRRVAEARWGLESAGFAPFEGRRALDVGCGGGLLAEPLTRLGAAVTGIDASSCAIAVARGHAEGQGLAIDYRVGGLEALDDDAIGDGFDLVAALEVIEHVLDADAFARGLARALVPDGLLILSTPNRTLASRALLVAGAELTGMIPPGTHDASLFLTPDELTEVLAGAGLRVIDTRGLSPDLAHKGFRLSEDTSLDYLMTAVRA